MPVLGANAYTGLADVRDVLVPDGSQNQGTDTAASLSDSEIARAVNDAQAQVDAALASAPTFYPVPLPLPAPALAAELTRDIAAYLATLTWRKGSNVDAQNAVNLRYQRAQTILNSLASGGLVIPGFSEPPSSVATVLNVVPDVTTWWPDMGFGNGQTIPG